ncbi:MAG: hypothetical protein ACREBD_13485 [Blastocatellia bacterium]
MVDEMPVFQTPDHKVEMKVAIHFYEMEKASILLEIGATGAAANFCEVFLFTLFALRQLATVGEPECNMLAEQFLNLTPLVMAHFANSPETNDVKIVPYPGYEAGKVLFANCTLTQENHSFYFNTKGFGWLSRGIGYYSPIAVFVFLRHLAIKHAKDEWYLTKLMDAARLCGLFHLQGKLNLTNQSEIAFMVGGTLLHANTLE